MLCRFHAASGMLALLAGVLCLTVAAADPPQPGPAPSTPPADAATQAAPEAAVLADVAAADPPRGSSAPPNASPAAPAAADARDAWHTDYAEALREARKLGRPVLVHFHARWCRPCRKMEAEVLNTAEVRALLKSAVVGAKLDIDVHAETAQQFNVETVPQDLLITAEGKVLQRWRGFQKRETYVAQVTQGEQLFAQRKPASPAAAATRPASQSTPAGPGTTASSAETASPAAHTASAPDSGRKPQETATSSGAPRDSAVELAAPEPFLGLDGYCPVTLWKTRKWTAGSESHTWEYQGLTYRFAGAAEREEFKKRPERYSPKLLGCDAVVFAREGRTVAGSPKYAAYFNSELFLFVNAATRSTFKQAPERYNRLAAAPKREELVRK